MANASFAGDQENSVGKGYKPSNMMLNEDQKQFYPENYFLFCNAAHSVSSRRWICPVIGCFRDGVGTPTNFTSSRSLTSHLKHVSLPILHCGFVLTLASKEKAGRLRFTTRTYFSRIKMGLGHTVVMAQIQGSAGSN